MQPKRTIIVSLPVQLAILAILVVVVAFAARATAELTRAGYSPASTFAGYSYEESSCSTAVDPITIVFTNGSGAIDDPYQHARYSDHGGLSTHTADHDQYFYDYDYGCSSSDDGAADGSHDRLHFRNEVAYTTAYGQSYAATPHTEEWLWDYWPFTGHHCVHWYGFTEGRYQVYTPFTSTASDGHAGTTNNYWGNTMAIEKCDNEWAYTNGYVWYIDLP
jgi:hypothetical protein